MNPLIAEVSFEAETDSHVRICLFSVCYFALDIGLLVRQNKQFEDLTSMHIGTQL